MQPETRFKLKVHEFLKTLPNTWFVKVQQRSVCGIPDDLLCIRGQFVALELKVPPNKVEEGSLQEFNLQKIKRSGGLALEVTPQNFDATAKLLIELATGKRVLVHEPADDARAPSADH